MEQRVLYIATHGGAREGTIRHLRYFEPLGMPLVFLSPEDDKAEIPGYRNIYFGESSHAHRKMIKRFIGYLNIMAQEGAPMSIYAEWDQLFLRPLPEWDGNGIGCVRLPKYVYSHFREFKAEWFPIVPYYLNQVVLHRIVTSMHRYDNDGYLEQGHLDRWLACVAEGEKIPLFQVPGAWVALHGYDFQATWKQHRDAVADGMFVVHPIKSATELAWVEQHCGVKPYAR